MSSLETATLLQNNPVYLESNSPAGDTYQVYGVYLSQLAVCIGRVEVDFMCDGTKKLGNPEIIRKYRDNGYGLGLYIAAATKELDASNPHSLYSDAGTLNADSRNIWESLVRRGLAIANQPIDDSFHIIDAVLTHTA